MRAGGKSNVVNFMHSVHREMSSDTGGHRRYSVPFQGELLSLAPSPNTELDAKGSLTSTFSGH
jgi:hypothetical protein